MYIFLVIIIILLILDKIIDKYFYSTPSFNDNYYKYFSRKTYLLTPTELKFYNLLKQITDKLNLNLFCQVSMYQLVNCKDYKHFNKIRSKCIDFVVTEKNCKIKCCIELDDYSHNSAKRQKRDEVVNNIFQNINLNLIRVKVQNYYDLSELEDKIKNSN